ncbi:uncharacterized protein LOC122014963 [Zingiber officinale]|uniref:Membrane lipoprotein n=1 Tax=Zingiber officinale TaxID=94328 RepID=A0A8J5HTA7_ZINOF|nr:uncharacterized protein LOC122014963 [Zingiber officinale]KAG6530957.1 hypothetical protein ZIOFF_004727 [Zingiber officinale]
MRSLSNLGVCLSLVSGFLFLALVAELYYLFWWKKKNRANRGREDGGYRSCSAKKIFLPLFSWRNPSSLSTTAINPHEISNPLKAVEEEDGTVEAELKRLQGLAGPPRFLFTIEEETKEDLESEDGRSRKGSRGKSLSDLFVTSSTPFLTPLSSPPFFTPPLTPMFEPLMAEEFIKMCSSPPPKFKFLKDAEEKLQRKKLIEEARKITEEEEGSFISIKIGWTKDKGQQQHSSSSQVIPLANCKPLR